MGTLPKKNNNWHRETWWWWTNCSWVCVNQASLLSELCRLETNVAQIKYGLTTLYVLVCDDCKNTILFEFQNFFLSLLDLSPGIRRHFESS